MTITRSASITVDSRWAITTRVALSSRVDSMTHALRLVVQRAGGLVEEEDARAADQRLGDHQALPLAAGDGAAAVGERWCACPSACA